MILCLCCICCYSDCISVMGCQWCQVHKDRLSPISTPYCADQRLCFGGIEEAATPYGDEIRGLYKLQVILHIVKHIVK